MNENQKRELESFLKRTEGAPPPVFVGRAEVLDDVALAAEQVWKGTGTDPHGAAKTTRIIQGAPGAGKSSIINEIKQNPNRLFTKSVGKTPMVVALKSGDIEEPIDILQPLVKSINPSAAAEFLSQYSQTSGGEVGIGFGPTRVGGKEEKTVEPTRLRTRWDVFGTWVEQHGGFDRPIVLAIDEAQRFKRDSEDPLSKLFQSLHDGCGLPIGIGVGRPQRYRTLGP
ncbi:MAG: ATP-binding protein [Gammaproteobacteria bacterium]|nr:ATP-binding protein [Gammaproteobacteria bacterium]